MLQLWQTLNPPMESRVPSRSLRVLGALTAPVWMRGPSYTNNHGTWTTAVVALILPPKR